MSTAKIADTSPSCTTGMWIISTTAICIIRTAATWMSMLFRSATLILTNARLERKATTGSTFTDPTAATPPFPTATTWIIWWMADCTIRMTDTATITGQFSLSKKVERIGRLTLVWHAEFTQAGLRSGSRVAVDRQWRASSLFNS